MGTLATRGLCNPHWYRVQYMPCRVFLLHVNINTSIVSKITKNINRILTFAFVAAQNGERPRFSQPISFHPSHVTGSRGRYRFTKEARGALLFTEIIEAKLRLQTDWS